MKSGGSWNDPQTWVDSFGNHGVPGLVDFAVIGGATVTGSGRFDVGSVSISGGRVAWQPATLRGMILSVHGIFTIAAGSLDHSIVDILPGAVGELVNSADLQFEKTSEINNRGTLNIHGSGGVFGAKNILNQSVVNWLAPLTIHPLAGFSPAADARTINSSFFSNSGLISGGAKLIGQDGSSLIGQDGSSFTRYDGGSIVAGGAGNIVAVVQVTSLPAVQAILLAAEVV